MHQCDGIQSFIRTQHVYPQVINMITATPLYQSHVVNMFDTPLATVFVH